MNFLPSVLSTSFSRVVYGIACVTAAVLVVVKFARSSKLNAIPTVGSSGWFGSLWAGLRFLTNATDIVQEGCEEHESVPFKVASIFGWIVVVSNRKHIEELRKATDDELSFGEAINDQLNTRYTLGDEIHDNRHLVAFVRSRLTRNLGIMYSEIRDEIVTALDEIMDLKCNEWKSISVSDVVRNVVCRTTNRVFVGLPLCHNPDWIDVNLRHSVNIVKTGFVIGLFPKFIRRLVACFLMAFTQDTRRAVKLLGPIIQDRLKHLDGFRDDLEAKTTDLSSWLLREAKGSQTVRSVTTNVLHLNFIAIHTTSSSFTYALLYLAANPQFIQPLREEVEAIVEEEGWSKTALDKMHKVDSFLRECQRIEGISTLGMMRKALKDFRFADGTFIPKGTLIGVATRSLHHDAQVYENPVVFEPFRFADREEGKEDGSKRRFVSTSVEYHPFGHGRHACPGRFFAAIEMKTMLAHVVMTYDVKLDDDATTRPQRACFANASFPDPRAKVLFRRVG